MTKSLGKFLLLYACMTMFLACSPHGDVEENIERKSKPQKTASTAIKIGYAEILGRLEALEESLKSSSSVLNLSLIGELKKSLPSSFPLEIPTPFSLHSLQDILMKNTRAIKNRPEAELASSWQGLLKLLDKKIVQHGNLEFPLDTGVLASVLSGTEPTLVAQLHNDFSGILSDAAQKDERNSISLESFWQPAFLYASESGYTAKEDTGGVVITDQGKMVGILEFKNHLAMPRIIDLKSYNDITNEVSKTPGYVSSVARRAAYARFGIGKMMFKEFFKYARDKRIAESYLHVRADNSAAINLYESLGYVKVATVPRYYSANPRIDAYLMRKKI